MLKIEDLSNCEAEQQLIGILLRDQKSTGGRNFSIVKSQLTSEDFFDRKNKIIYSAILDLFEQDNAIDIVTVSEYLKFKDLLNSVNGRTYINDCVLMDEGDTIQLVKIILKYSKKRQLINILNDSLQDIESKDVDDIMISSTNKIQSILNRTSSTTCKSISYGIAEALDNFETITQNNNGLLGLDTGFNDINILLSGLCPSRFYILAARPSVGKSALAQQIAEYIAQDKVVLYISLEMSVCEYTQRSIYRRSGFNQSHLSSGTSSFQSQVLETFNKSAYELENLKLYIVDQPECTISSIEKNIQECNIRYGACDLIIIDYLQLMQSDQGKSDDYDIVTSNSKRLKQLAKKYNIPVMALSQLSREVEKRQDKKPILADLRDSGSLEQDADVVMFIYRPEMYFTQPQFQNRAYIILAKNRQGKRGVEIPLIFNDRKVEFLNSNY